MIIKLNYFKHASHIWFSTSGTIANDQMRGLDLFQLDVNAWQGSSGAPLILEETKEVVGILVAGLTDEFQGINFAIKINYVRSVLEANGIDLN